MVASDRGSPSGKRGPEWRAPIELAIALARIAQLGPWAVPSHGEAALRFVAKDGHELGALAGLGAQGLVGDDQRRSRRRRRRDPVAHFLRNDDAIQLAFCAARVSGDRLEAAPAIWLWPRMRLDDGARLFIVQGDDAPS